jgi:hypothetical protein
MITCD